MKIRAVAVALALVLGPGLVGCGGTEPSVVDEPVPGTEAPTITEAPAPPTEATAKVGDTLELSGMDEGERMAVTVIKVVNPAKGKDEFTAPEPGMRFVGVQFRLRNTGTAVYDDSPDNGATVVDTEGQNFGPTYSELSAGRVLGEAW